MFLLHVWLTHDASCPLSEAGGGARPALLWFFDAFSSTVPLMACTTLKFLFSYSEE